jgi:hypothetical protein
MKKKYYGQSTLREVILIGPGTNNKYGQLYNNNIYVYHGMGTSGNVEADKPVRYY